MAGLREHRAAQVVERLQMGAGWTDSDLVSCRVDGTLLHPERFSRSFGDAVRRLGHANIGITLDTYSHVTGSLHNDAAETVAALFTDAR